MNIKSKILSVLSNTSHPVYYATNHDSGSNNTFAIFYIVDEKTHSNYDDEENATYYKINIQVISNSDYDVFADEILNLMLSAGFRRLNSVETYDSTTNLYMKSIFFNYVDYKLCS